jgi:hypothetical protein
LYALLALPPQRNTRLQLSAHDRKMAAKVASAAMRATGPLPRGLGWRPLYLVWALPAAQSPLDAAHAPDPLLWRRVVRAHRWSVYGSPCLV